MTTAGSKTKSTVAPILAPILARLDDALSEAGLGGQIRTGASLRAARPSDARDPLAHPRTVTAHPPGGVAETERAGEVGRSLGGIDGLLRPLERPDQGRLIALSGEPSSGRTALAYRLAAGATARGELCGWVDLPDALDPRFLRRSGANLEGLLWTRPPHARAALRAAELMIKTGFAVVVVDLEGARERELARLGAAAWTRLLRAVQGTRGTAVVLGPERVSGSFPTLGIHTERCQPVFDRGLFEGLEGCARVVRNRTGPTDTSFPFRVFHRPQTSSC